MTQTNYFGTFCPKAGFGEAPPTSVFAARRDAKIASVATLALLAVSASPGNPTKNGGGVIGLARFPLFSVGLFCGII